MNNKQMKFPYPVLGLGDDIQGEWGCSYTSVADNEYITYKIEVSNVLDELHDLLKQHKVQYTCEILCNKTFLRKVESSFEDNFTITISRSDIRDTLTLTLYIIATEDQPLYRSKLFKQVYLDNIKFLPNIQKGEILAQLPAYSIPVDIDYSEYNSRPIFEIVKGDEEEEFVYAEYHKDTISIVLPQNDFVLMNQLYSTPEFQSILNTCFLNKVLSDALKKLMDTPDNAMYSDKIWAQKLKCLLLDDKFSDLDLESDNDKIVQMLLKDPYGRVLKDLSKLK